MSGIRLLRREVDRLANQDGGECPPSSPKLARASNADERDWRVPAGAWRRAVLFLAAGSLSACSGDSPGPSSPPEIRLSVANITFDATQGGANPAPQSITVSNGQSGNLEGLTATVTYQGTQSGWLQASLAGTRAPATLTLAVSAAGLTPGTHNATVAVNGIGASTGPKTVQVTLNLAAPPLIQLSAASISFTATAGGGDPQPSTVSITNGGGGTLAGLNTAVTYAGQQGGWLNASLSSTTAPSTLTLTAIVGGRAAGSYDATVTLSGTQAANRTLSVRLTVSTPVPPTPTFPLSAGKRWRYLLGDTTTVVASNAVSTFRTNGVLILHVLDQGTVGGRTAWRLHGYELGDATSPDDAFDVQTFYLSTDATGLLRYVSGSWRRVLSSSSNLITNGTLILGGIPQHNPSVTLTAGSITVPAGSFQTTLARHHHREGWMGNSAEDIDETRIEHFAAGMGTVFASWDYTREQNLNGISLYSRRTQRLTHMDTGPFPDIAVEAAAHTSTTSAQTISTSSLTFANVQLGDAGAVLTDAAVGCSSVCIQPNQSGVKRLEDWYKVVASGTTGLRIELDYPVSGQNDLDLYLFESVGGQLRFVASSLNSSGKRELLRRTVGGGTYYVAVQAWDTPAGRSDYWLSVRTY